MFPLMSEEILVETAIIILGIGIIASAYYLVRSRSLLYSAYALALIGFLNAGLFGILGLTVVAAVQIVIYVGAAVLFIILTFSLMGEVRIEVAPLKKILFPTILLFIVFFLFIHRVISLLPQPPSLTEAPSFVIPRFFASEYMLSAILIVLVAATSAVESILIARKELEVKSE